MTWDAIVVGAGTAGLAAGGALARRGRRVVVLDARERVGGRMDSRRSREGKVVELGPEFIHGGNWEFWAALRRMGVRPRELRMAQWRKGKGDGFERAEDGWERIAAVMEKFGAGGAGRKSVAQIWQDDLPAEDAQLTRNFIEGFEAAPLEEMSAKAMAAVGKEEKQWNLPRGYADLAQRMEREFVRAGGVLALGRAAVRVEWAKAGVSVATREGGRVEGRTAVITVPPGVEREIEFAPGLPARAAVAQRAELGVVRRVALEMKRGFWRQKRMPLGLVRADGAFPTWWTRQPCIVGWCGGPRAKKLIGLSEGAVRRVATSALAEMLGCSRAAIERDVIACWSHDWVRDPLTRGAYSFARAGEGMDWPKTLGKPQGKVLFFAGEATAKMEEIGTVHGAYATGLRAARQVLGVLD